MTYISPGLKRVIARRNREMQEEVVARLHGVALRKHLRIVEHILDDEVAEESGTPQSATSVPPAGPTTADLIAEYEEMNRRYPEVIGARLVIVESPYAGDVERNLRYLRAALRDCLLRGEAPFASHGLYTQPGVLDDTIPAEREQGIQAGLCWGAVAEATVVYTDLGVSSGMTHGIKAAKDAERLVEYRSLLGWAHAD